MLKTRDRIISAQDLARQVQVALANAQQEPLVVLDSSEPAAYLISVELFDRILAYFDAANDEELLAALSVAEAQFAQGKYKTLEEAEAILAAAWHQSEAESTEQ
jgi:PHD/YefM family antitoxin component YafN of YafNO toxin-antitoxin module